MGDAGRRTGGSDFEPGTERRRRRFNAGASQFFLQTFETPSCRLNDQRRPRVVPSDKAISLRLSIARGPTLDDPIGMCRRPVPRLPSPLPTKVSQRPVDIPRDRKSTRLNSSHRKNTYAVFCLKKKIELYDNLAYTSYIYNQRSPKF